MGTSHTVAVMVLLKLILPGRILQWQYLGKKLRPSILIFILCTKLLQGVLQILTMVGRMQLAQELKITIERLAAGSFLKFKGDGYFDGSSVITTWQGMRIL